uniref:Uncharacterized protein n=1 Tax=Anguilla anguilla TaxID=7936 RepID=A0A0E9U357_ANGAN
MQIVNTVLNMLTLKCVLLRVQM